MYCRSALSCVSPTGSLVSDPRIIIEVRRPGPLAGLGTNGGCSSISQLVPPLGDADAGGRGRFQC